MQNRLKKNIVFSFLYQFLMLCFPLIITPYISRTLGAEGIGFYTYHQTIAQYFMMFIMLGLANYGNRTIAMCNRNDKNEVSRVFLEIHRMQFVTAIIIILVNIAYVIFLSNTPKYDSLFVLLTVSSLFDISWFYIGVQEIGALLARNLIIKILTLLFIIILVHNPDDVTIYSIIMIMSTLISQIVMWIPLRKRIADIHIKTKDSIIKHLKPNLVLFIPVVAVSLYKYMDKLMLGSMGSSIELGYYESVERLVNIPVSIVSALGAVMLPYITNLNVHGDQSRGIHYMRYSLYFTSFLASGLVFGMLGVISEFIPVFFGEGFERCVTLSYFMIPTVIFLGLSNVYRTQYLIPRELDKVLIGSVVLGAIVNVILNIFLIPIYNAIGAAIGTFFAEFSVFGYQLIKIPFKEKMIQSTIRSLIFIPAAVFMYVFLCFIPNFESIIIALIVKILIGGLFYLFLSGLIILLMNKFNPEFYIKFPIKNKTN